MAELRWTDQAADDLEAITEFIANDSPHYANLFAMRVLNAVERLEPFPESGRIVPETSEASIREILLGNYRIIYRYKGNLAELLTIHHSSRLLDLSRLT